MLFLNLNIHVWEAATCIKQNDFCDHFLEHIPHELLKLPVHHSIIVPMSDDADPITHL